jgi:coenzyme F420-reducing hydrogenase beta subunit
MKSSTHDIGPGTRNVSMNIPASLHDQIKLHAARSGMSVSAFCKNVLKQEIKDGVIFEKTATKQQLKQVSR